MDGCVVMTGAASGIGMAVAEMLLARHPRVSIGMIDLAEGAMAEFAARHPGRVTTAGCDAGQRAEARAAVKAVAGERAVTGVVCAAGILRSRASIDMTDTEWRAGIGAHLDGSFFVARA